MTTQATLTLSDLDLYTVASFAAKAGDAFACQTIRPNGAVYSAASRVTRRHDCEIVALADRDGLYTVYGVRPTHHQRYRAMLLVDAETNETIDLQDDEDATREMFPELLHLLD